MPSDPLDALAEAHADILKGWGFVATLQLRTPLAVLEHHGEQVELGQPRPSYGPEWAGTWVPVTKSWAELGLPSRAEGESPMASAIGPALSSELLPFLKRYRAIVETEAPVADRIAAVRRLAADPTVVDIAARFGPRLPHGWASDALRETLGITERIADALIAAGLLDAQAVRAASDEQLLAVPGVGRKALATLGSKD